MACEDCGLEYPLPEPRLYSFNSPLGACPKCEGFGNVIGIDMELVVPDPSKTLREGAVAPWNSPAYSHELDELIPEIRTMHSCGNENEHIPLPETCISKHGEYRRK